MYALLVWKFSIENTELTIYQVICFRLRRTSPPSHPLCAALMCGMIHIWLLLYSAHRSWVSNMQTNNIKYIEHKMTIWINKNLILEYCIKVEICDMIDVWLCWLSSRGPGLGKWHDDMETLLTLCEGNPPLTCGSPHKRPLMQSCDGFLCWICKQQTVELPVISYFLMSIGCQLNSLWRFDTI